MNCGETEKKKVVLLCNVIILNHVIEQRNKELLGSCETTAKIRKAGGGGKFFSNAFKQYKFS
jgi:hypothetical protein